MTSKSQEPLTRPDKPIVIYSDVKVFETLHGPVLRDWPSYHIHEVIAWYAWHAPADGVRGREARVGGIEDGVWRWAQRTGRGSGGWPACARPRLSPGVLVQDSHRSPFCAVLIEPKQPGSQGTAPGCGGGPRVRPRREAWPAAPASRRLRLSVTSPPGRRGTKPPASLRGTRESGSTGQTRSSTPPPACGGVRRGPQASAWGLAARKGAVWAEGLAEGAPWVRPGTMRLPVVG